MNNLRTKVFTAPLNSGEFPENNDPVMKEWKEKHSSNIGIAISGGGMRSASVTVGFLLGLNDLDILSKLKYVSLNSGSSWVGLILFFAAIAEKMKDSSVPIKTIYNKLLLDIKDDKLSKIKFLKAFENIAFRLCCPAYEKTWCATVKRFMRMFKCFDDPEYLDNIIDPFKNSSICQDLTFHIVNATVIDNNRKHQIPFEFTPYYCGIPLNSPISRISGGFVRPSLFNCNFKEDDEVIIDDQDLFVEKNPPHHGIHMSDISGISSSAVAMTMFKYKISPEFLGTAPRFQFATPTLKSKNGFNPYSMVGELHEFADGAAIDNTSLHALLRRQVKNIMVCHSTHVPYDSYHENKDFIVLFGKADVRGVVFDESNEEYNYRRKVFYESDWDKIRHQMDENNSNELPLVCYMPEMEVMANEFVGIKAYKANILFYLSSLVKSWPVYSSIKNKLKNKANQLAVFRSKGVDSDFPHIPVHFLNYKQELVGSIADNSRWGIQNSEGMKLFLNDVHKLL